MRIIKLSKKFKKKLNNLKGQQEVNVIKKIREIQNCLDINHYKNLKGNLKKYKRVHVNTSYVVLFYDKKSDIIFFEDYAHHDKIYLKGKIKK